MEWEIEMEGAEEQNCLATTGKEIEEGEKMGKKAEGN